MKEAKGRSLLPRRKMSHLVSSRRDSFDPEKPLLWLLVFPTGRGRGNCKHSCCLGPVQLLCGLQQKTAPGDRSDAAYLPRVFNGY